MQLQAETYGRETRKFDPQITPFRRPLPSRCCDRGKKSTDEHDERDEISYFCDCAQKGTKATTQRKQALLLLCKHKRRMPQALPRLGVARKASRDLLIALPRFGVRRGNLLELAGVFEGVAGVAFIFFADRYSSSAGSSFSLSEVSWTVSSLRFLPSTREDASLLRTIRMVPVDAEPEVEC